MLNNQKITEDQFKTLLPERFWSKIKFSDGCWEWTSGIDRYGYGQFRARIGGVWKTITAHRFCAFTILKSIPISPDLCVLHKCDNRKCVNPNHLFLGSNIDNINDMDSKKRRAIGQLNGNAKLSNEDVLLIKQKILDKQKRQSLADEFQISISTVKRIKAGSNWSHIAL